MRLDAVAVLEGIAILCTDYPESPISWANTEASKLRALNELLIEANIKLW
jgi:hypothetical protein